MEMDGLVNNEKEGRAPLSLNYLLLFKLIIALPSLEV